MKTKKRIALTITSIIIALFFTHKTNAQTIIGGGIAYGTEIESIGVNATGQFFIQENIAIAPSFTYYLPKTIAGDFSLKWYEINADVNYYFEIPDSKIKFYGLAGLNLSFVSIPSFNFGGFGISDSNTNSEFGFNIGAGADFNIDKKITPFAQLKYTISSVNQLAIMAGIRYELGK